MNDTFKAPDDGRPYDFGTIKLRELTGRDDAKIAARCKGMDDPWMRQMERVRAAIVEVDGKAVSQPYEEFDLWRERSRLLAQTAYGKMNGLDEQTVSGFLNGSRATTPTQP
jgi:hypothetical protein